MAFHISNIIQHSVTISACYFCQNCATTFTLNLLFNKVHVFYVKLFEYYINQSIVALTLFLTIAYYNYFCKFYKAIPQKLINTSNWLKNKSWLWQNFIIQRKCDLKSHIYTSIYFLGIRIHSPSPTTSSTSGKYPKIAHILCLKRDSKTLHVTHSIRTCQRRKNDDNTELFTIV